MDTTVNLVDYVYEQLVSTCKTHTFGYTMYRGFKFIVRSDSYVNATKLCATYGKTYSNWRKLLDAKKYIERIEKRCLPIDVKGILTDCIILSGTDKNDVVVSGTYVSPMLLVKIARWASNEFDEFTLALPTTNVINYVKIKSENNGETFGTREFMGINVVIMLKNEYMNATKICAQYNKKYFNWHQQQSSKELIAFYTNKENTPATIVVEGGDTDIRGTYVSQALIPDIFRWLSIELYDKLYIVNRDNQIRIDQLNNELAMKNVIVNDDIPMNVNNDNNELVDTIVNDDDPINVVVNDELVDAVINVDNKSKKQAKKWIKGNPPLQHVSIADYFSTYAAANDIFWMLSYLTN